MLVPELNLENQIKPKEKNELTSNVLDFVSIPNCSDKEEFFKTISSFNSSKAALLLKFQIRNSFIDLSSVDVYKLNKICRHKPAVIILESENGGNFSIYWKLSELEEFLVLKDNENLDLGDDKKLHEFIANFLALSVQNNHLGEIYLI